MQAKLCTRCKIEKPLSEFYKDKTKKSGLAFDCKTCRNTRNRTWAKEHVNRVKTLHIQCYQRHQTEYRIRAKQWKIENPIKQMLIRARRRAKIENLPFDLTVDDVSIPEQCPILAIPVFPSQGRLGPNSPSLDRRVPSKGYIKGNVQVISMRANLMKNDASEHELIAFAGWVAETYGL